MMTQWRKLLMAILPALFVLVFAAAPIVAFAADDEEASAETGDDHASESSESHGDESGEMMVGSAEGAGITLSLLGLILAIVFFVVLVGAVGLGVIGVGYWQSMAD